MVDAFLEAVKDALKQQHNIEVRGFGTFKIRRRKTRMARNPRTGDPVEVAARPVPVFKPSKELRALVADEGEPEAAESAPGHVARRAGSMPWKAVGVAPRGLSSSPVRPIVSQWITFTHGCSTASTVTVRVLLFASYAERLGLERVELTLPPPATVARRVERPPGAARRRPSSLPTAVRPQPGARRAGRRRSPTATRSRCFLRWPEGERGVPHRRSDRSRRAARRGAVARRAAASRRSSGRCATTTRAARCCGWSTRPTARWPKPSARGSWRRRSALARRRRAPPPDRAARDRRRGGGDRGWPSAHRDEAFAACRLRDRRGQAPRADLEAGALRRRHGRVGGSRTAADLASPEARS